ncbi:hypothetical protein FEF05_02935 [Glaesserella parasuis]|uniref:hypothetical protein n=1 Tax=Glaesserella parasuis TaxID=738 RepID=UPI0011ED22AC|nr:hypothetical protein [Glaesserella parasuis]QEM87530.1 hypothetical protein FEF05_02935 [Glaesserella parasuis]
MADLKKINAEYIKHLGEEKVKLNEDVYNDLKNGIGTDLCHKNLDFLIRLIKLEFYSIENEYILLINNILKSVNISNDNANQILQEIQSRTNQNKESLNYYLTKLDDLIKLLQSNINVAPKFKMHSQGKADKKPKEEKNIIQAFAKKMWDETPDTTRDEILDYLMQSGRRFSTSTRTIKDKWLKEIDPMAKQGIRRKRK